MDNKTRRTAEKFGILERIEKLEENLLSIENVTEVIFDIDGFYDDLNEVVFLTKYDIPSYDGKYFETKVDIIKKVFEIVEANDLTKTEDPIEDYGAHLYFVTACRKAWKATTVCV